MPAPRSSKQGRGRALEWVWVPGGERETSENTSQSPSARAEGY